MSSNRPIWLLVLLVSSGRILSAQSPEDGVRKVQQAMIAAARAGDKAAYQRLYADDLRWMDADSGLMNKPQRIAEVTASPAFNRDFQTEVKVYGDIAIESGVMAYTRGGEKHADHVLRVYINRNGQWQLLSHAAVAAPTVAGAARDRGLADSGSGRCSRRNRAFSRD